MPGVLASDSMVGAEEANRRRLERATMSGTSVSVVSGDAAIAGTQEESFGEWNAALERPLRLPGRVSTICSSALPASPSPNRREGSNARGYRALLLAGSSGSKEGAAADQWAAQTEVARATAGGFTSSAATRRRRSPRNGAK